MPRHKHPIPISMPLTAGVTIEGVFHPRQSGDSTTPPVESYVDPDSLRITGRPDLVALWLDDLSVDANFLFYSEEISDGWLNELASQLREHHEDRDHIL